MNRKLASALTALLVCGTLAAQGTTKPTLTADDVITAPRVNDPQVSPDGKSVLYTVGEASFETNKVVNHIWMVPMAGGEPRQITKGTGETEPRWSPDGQLVAFVTKKDGLPQIHVMKPDGSEIRTVTSVSTGASGIVWAPDGKKLAFAADVYPAIEGDAAQKAEDERREKSGVKAQIFTGLLFRHWNAFRDGKRSQIFVANVADGAVTQVTKEDREAPPFNLGGPSDYAFSPDSKLIYFTRGAAPPAEAWSTNADLCAVPAEGGPVKCLTANNLGWDGSPVPSPDGKWVAYRSQARGGYESDLFRLMLLKVEDGTTRRTATALEDGVDEILWLPNGNLLVSTEEGGSHAWFEVKPNSDKIEKVWSGPNSYSASLTADAKTAVVVHATLVNPPDLFRFNTETQDFARLTSHGLALTKSRAMPTRAPVTWRGAGNESIQGWVIYPPNFDATKLWPMLAFIHGGPQGAWMDAWSTRWNPAIYAAQGYVVFAPNPHGSTGFGHPFCEQISGDWGGAVYEDIERGLDAMIATGYIDANRLGAAGGSYGGYMVNWLLGHDHRFKALVSHAGVYNLEAMYGTTEEVWFAEWEFKGPPWENPELYRKWSPNQFVAAFKTPTLVVHGELDYRVPVSQGLELFTALQRKGIPSKFLYYPDEGHWVLKPKNGQLWNKTVLEWFDQWLKTK